MAISICIPAYKARRFLPETLASIAAQSYNEWELIVVEDGSNDGTAELVREFGLSVPQSVRYIRHDVNRGLTSTRNTGISAARCSHIAILDADDLWNPHHLAACAEVLTQGQYDLVHGGSILFDSDSGRELEVRAPSANALGRIPLSVFTQEYIIQPSSVVIEKGLWNRVGGFDPSFQHVEDLDMWLRCLRAGARLGYSGQATCHYRKHASAMSGESYPMAAAFARVYGRHLDWEAIPFGIRRNRAASSELSAARLCWRSDPEAARRHAAVSWRLRPSPRALVFSLGCAILSFLSRSRCQNR